MLAFGPFTLDQRTYVLSKQGAMVPLSPKLVQVLACLAEARGELVTRELLFDRYWPDLNVTDNTLTRAIADIRKVLDDDPGEPTYIQTMARRGYRFVAPVRVETPPADAATPGVVAVPQGLAGLEPFIAWERGRMVLESLDVPTLPAAVQAFSRAVAGAPQYAAAHAGLANAHIFTFEATRVDNVPNVDALRLAILSATRATELDPTMGEGWAALGHALGASGRVEESRAALRQALALEPRNWRHQYRTAVGTWGEERLRAVERAEALLPGFAGAQTLAAMVLIARQSFDLATDVAERGVVAQRAQQRDHAVYPANGLLWMRGLTAAARGRMAAALEDFRAEARFSAETSTVYARECLVLAHEAEGFARLGMHDADAAIEAFTAASAASPGHGRALLGLAIAAAEPDLVGAVARACDDLARAGKLGEQHVLLAAAHAWRGDDGAAVSELEHLLARAAPDASGWSLPADPLFAPLRALPSYAGIAARLASRAA